MLTASAIPSHLLPSSPHGASRQSGLSYSGTWPRGLRARIDLSWAAARTRGVAAGRSAERSGAATGGGRAASVGGQPPDPEHDRNTSCNTVDPAAPQAGPRRSEVGLTNVLSRKIL